MADENFFVIEFEPESIKSYIKEDADLGMLGRVNSVETTLERMVSKSTKREIGIAAVHQTAISDNMASEINREPNKIAVRDMETSLISPVSTLIDQSSSSSKATIAPQTGPTWGVNEVLGSHPEKVDGNGVKVAILDTGIVDPNEISSHQAFSDITSLHVEDFTDYDQSDANYVPGVDENGHGTHCAGTILGRDVDGVRIGVAPGVNDVFVGKVLNRYGRGRAGWLLKAMKSAYLQEANIISISIGFDFPKMRERLMQNDEPPEIATSKTLKAYRENLRAFDIVAKSVNAAGLDYPGAVIRCCIR